MPSPPTTSTPTSTTSLSQQINASTRQTHTTLNRAVLSLLPLAFPPHAQDGRLCARGMSYILPIYAAFEDSFAKVLALPPELRSPKAQAVAGLHIPALERASRLQHDINRLLPSPEDKAAAAALAPDLLPLLTSFVQHIYQISPTQPHLLLAYIHTFYLALFSGGRYIRSQLLTTGGFPNEILSFWSFDTPLDGEEMKADFKARFSEVESALTEQQKEEVVREAGWIMERMVGVVEEIADTVGRSRDSVVLGAVAGERIWWKQEKGRYLAFNGSERWMVLKHLLPVGLAELIFLAGLRLLEVACWDRKGAPQDLRAENRTLNS